MIPKTLHFCWFGKNPRTPLVEKCVESWKKNLTGFEIVEWNEDNFDVTQNAYCREAFEARKWAFVSDYARLSILYHHGGVYADADLEVIKPIDKFLEHSAFSGYESAKIIPTAIMGAEKGHSWIKALLDDYDNRRFVMPDGAYDETANVIPITSRTVEMYGLNLNNETLRFGDGVVIYPTEYFCPLDFKTRKMNLTENTHTIHHFIATWWEEGKWDERIHKLRYRELMKEGRYAQAAEEIRLAYKYSKNPKHLALSRVLQIAGVFKK